jgi:hypothetical protein
MRLFRPRRVVQDGSMGYEDFGRAAWLVRTGGFRHPMPNRWLPAALLGGGLAAGTLLRSFSSIALPVALPTGVVGIWLGALLVDRLAIVRRARRGLPPGTGGDPSGDRAPRPHAPLAGAGAAAVPLPHDREPE